jgi:hypothetical protein
MAEFSMDERALEQLGMQAARDFSASMQPTLDALHDELAGQPVEQIKPRLAAAWRAKAGEALSEASLAEWSTAISDGLRIELETD